ncbi:pentapeptide repeat-containing protein [Campylobacter jejuni]|nr:pentapeptide repeat-containing protein [Campylobacter jejuni]
MIKETLEKILHTLEKCCEEIHQNNKSESDESKSKSGNQEASTKQKLSKVLSIDKQYIFDSSDEKTKEKTESVYNETIKKIKGKEDFRQRDELFSDDEKWYLICDEGGGKIDISLSYDKIKSIPCNVIFNNCTIDLHIDESKGTKKDNTETIKNHLYFYNCTFEKSLNLKNIIFEKTLTFNQCAFYNDLDIHQNQFLDHLVFINCSNEQNDKKIISLDLQENEFEGYLFIKNCLIEKINLWKNKFKNRCYFVDSKFGYKDKVNKAELNFSNAHFEDEVYFNNSEFYSYADFHECKFDNIACFYGVKFYKAPNFSACYFKEQKAANLINVDIDKLDFKSVEKYIEDNYEDESYINKTKGMQDEEKKIKIQNEYKLRYAKNLKDSFRVIKDILITQNNTLEAQEWHKLELYVKEKELEVKLDKYKENNINSKHKIKKIHIWNIIDVFMTKFSLMVCDIIFYLFLGLFLVQVCRVIKGFPNFIYERGKFLLSRVCCINSIDRILKLECLKIYRKISSLGKTMLDYTLWFDCILLQVYRNTSNHHTNFLKILNFTILMISLYAFMGFVFSKTINFISSFNPVSIIIANYFILFALIMVFFNVKRQLHQQGSILFFGIFGAFIVLMMSFLSPVYIPTFCFLIYFASILFFYLLFLCEIKLFVFILRLAAYGCLIVVIILKPQFINPFTGVFSSDELYESQFEKSLNDLNASAIINLASISQNDFNLHLKDQNISFTELDSAKALIVANKENLLKLNDVNSNIAKEVLGEKYTELLKTINQDKITENTIKSTSVLYGIILLLCIFSLQKTARKNSIVPS